MTSWQRQRVSVDGQDFVFHRTGGGKSPLVLCHGISDNGLCWTRVARALEDEFDIIMLDARGHGESSSAPPAPGADITDLIGVLDALDFPEVSLMGHSMGARTAAGVAAAAPARVSKLVLEDPPWRDVPPGAIPPEDSIAEGRNSFRAFVRSFRSLDTEQALDRAREFNSAWHEDELPAWVESKFQFSESVLDAAALGPWREVAAQIACPTLLITGDEARGAIVTDALRCELEASNRWIETKHLAGAGHNIRRECFDAYVAATRSFLLAG